MSVIERAHRLEQILTPLQNEAFEGITKSLTALGAFLSAIAGTYLGVDSVAEATTERFRTFWYWAPILFIVPVSYGIVFAFDRNTALYPSFYGGMLVGFIILALVVTARFYLFWHERPKIRSATQRSKKAGWIMLVIGFDLLFFAAIVDAYKFFGG